MDNRCEECLARVPSVAVRRMPKIYLHVLHVYGIVMFCAVAEAYKNIKYGEGKRHCFFCVIGGLAFLTNKRPTATRPTSFHANTAAVSVVQTVQTVHTAFRGRGSPSVYNCAPRAGAILECTPSVFLRVWACGWAVSGVLGFAGHAVDHLQALDRLPPINRNQ